MFKFELSVCIQALNKSLEQNPSCKFDIRSTGQEIHRILWNQVAHFRLEKNPPLNRILKQLKAVRTLTSYFFKINFNVVLPSTTSSSLQVFQLKFYVYFLFLHACCMSYTRLTNVAFMSSLHRVNKIGV
jgi:hypothetical protein